MKFYQLFHPAASSGRDHAFKRAIKLSTTVACVHLTSVAHAQSYWIESDQVINPSYSAAVFGARYKVDNNNWDMGVSDGQGAPSLTANLGNKNTLNNTPFSFSLTHIAGQGLIWSLTNTITSATTTLAWGSGFNPVLPAGSQSASTVNGKSIGSSFNSLQVYARANKANSSVSLSQLRFTPAGNSPLELEDGSFITPTTINENSSLTQRLVANTNLAAQDWVLSGVVSIYNQSGTGESVALNIYGETANFTTNTSANQGAGNGALNVVPEPSSALLISLTGLSFLMRRRR